MSEKNVYLKVKDLSVSGENFMLLHNLEFDMLETFPQPKEEKLSDYYKTDDYISHTDSKRNLVERAYHVVRSISLKRKLKLIESCVSNQKKLLDVGCGTGDFLQIAKNNNWKVLGIEPNVEARKIANSKTCNAVFEVDQLLKLEPNSFDVITLWHVLEHLPKLDEHLEIFKKLLKPNGTLILAVPNFKSFDAFYYKQYWAAFDVPRHLWHFSQKSISMLVSKKNMYVDKTLPMTFDSYYVSLLSEKYKKGTFNIFNAIRIGYLSNIKAKRSGEYSSLIYLVKNS